MATPRLTEAVRGSRRMIAAMSALGFQSILDIDVEDGEVSQRLLAEAVMAQDGQLEALEV